MKKLLYSAVAFATLLTAACQQENLEPVVTGENTVTYTVQVPQSMKTKAIGDQLAGKFLLTYEVYRADEVDDLSKGSFYENNTPIEFNANGVATLSLQFVKDQDYVVLFWANTEESAGLYNTTDLRKVSINNAWTANDVNAAAFSGIDTVSDCVSAKKGAVSLVRPVSQINIATSAESLELRGNTITLDQSFVTVDGLYGVYNVYDKTVSGENAKIAYDEANVPSGEFGTVENVTYNYVAMSYVGFAPETGTTVDVDFTFTTNEGEIQHSVPNVPIKPNYRTNILGNLISEEHAYTVTLDTDWADNGGNMEFVTDGLIKNLDGAYEVSTEKGLSYAMNNLFAQGGDFYLTKEIYDLSGFAVTPPTVPSGVTLNVYGEAPVVTRAAATVAGITIIGIDSFITTIENGATVSISGVTVQNEESAEVLLVKEVENGADVAISECAVVNSTEASEDIEDLIGNGSDNVLNASNVTTLEELQAALASGVETITVTGQIVIKNQEVTLDLNGKTVNGVYSKTGANYNLIDVNSNAVVTVKNGTITAEFTGNNMGWGASTNVFNVTAGGVLNLENVTAQNLGGSDMAFVAHLNNWGEVTLNVNNSTLESPYVAVRVFNSGNDMNNVTIQNSTLKGKYCFWVHNYTLADFGNSQDKVDTQKALLNFDIFNGTNKFEFNNTNNAPVRYGFTDSIYLDANGYQMVADGVSMSPEGVYVISNTAGLTWLAETVNSGNTFAGKTIELGAEIDLNNESWTCIGTENTPFSGIFNGKDFSIKNLSIIDSEAKEGKAYVGFFGYAKNATIKNVIFENVNLNIACLDIDHSQGHIGAVAGSLEGTSTIENVTVKGDIKVESTLENNGASRVAVVAGGNSYGNVTMKNVHVIANEGSYLKANNNVGALAGQLQNIAVFENCTSNIDVTGYKFFAGGIIGLTAGDSKFTNCHTTGDIKIIAGREGRGNDQYRVGGIAGGWADGATKVCTLEGCTYTGKVSGNNADGSVAEPLDYAGYVGRGYTLNGCGGSKVVIDNHEYIQVSDNVHGFYTVDGVYEIGNAAALVAMSSISLKEGEKVVLIADIDLDGVEFNGLSAHNPENNNTFDGQEYTVSNWTYTGKAADMGFIKNWVGPIKNLTIENASLQTAGRSAVIAAKVYSNIENCHVINCSIEDSYWACGLIAGLYNGGSVSNCSVVNSTVKSNGGTGAIVGVLNETAGERSFTNCKVEGCTVNNTGVYGEAYCGALVCGMINISNSTVKFKGCEFSNNTKGAYVGDLYYAAGNNTIIVE